MVSYFIRILYAKLIKIGWFWLKLFKKSNVDYKINSFSYIFYLPLYLVAHVNFLLNEYDDDDDDDGRFLRHRV